MLNLMCVNQPSTRSVKLSVNVPVVQIFLSSYHLDQGWAPRESMMVLISVISLSWYIPSSLHSHFWQWHSFQSRSPNIVCISIIFKVIIIYIVLIISFISFQWIKLCKPSSRLFFGLVFFDKYTHQSSVL